MYGEDSIEHFIMEELQATTASDHLAPDESLVASGILDSLGLIRLADFLGEHFHIQVEQAEVIPDNFESINAITAFIERKRVQAGPPSDDSAESAGR